MQFVCIYCDLFNDVQGRFIRVAELLYPLFKVSDGQFIQDHSNPFTLGGFVATEG